MLNTKYVMFVVLSAAVLTGLTATGMSLGQTAFASENSGDEKYQRNGQENNCKIENENKDSDNSRVSDITNNQYCQNLGQNSKDQASVDGDPFSGHNEEDDSG
jgi:hypothetical protein